MILSKKSIVKNENVKKFFVEGDITETFGITEFDLVCPGEEYFSEDKDIESFAERKKRSAVLVSSYDRLADWKLRPRQEKMIKEKGFYTRCSGFGELAEKVKKCGSDLKFRHSIDLETGEISKEGKLWRANFCRDRLCPMCNWRRAKKCYNTIKRAMRYALEKGKTLENSYSWIFVTLTVPNVPGEKLKATIQHLQKSFNRFMHYKKMQIVQGFYRTLEITVNPINNTFHPHFHILMAVPKSYFARNVSADERGYIEQEEFLKMWQRATEDKSISQVYVERVHGKKSNNGKRNFSVSDALKEVAKYTLKDTDFLITPHNAYTDKHGRFIPQVTAEQAQTMTDNNVYWLSCALEGVRLIGFGGIVRDVLKRINADDVEDGDLVNIGDDVSETAPLYFVRHYHWNGSKYEIVEEGCDTCKDGENIGYMRC